VRNRYRLTETSGIDFAVIDALSLPFEDRSVDVLYGYAMVHHLSDLDLFLSEVARVLAPGGRCVFMDNCYSPAWQAAKLGVLRPLMQYFHERGGISPEDYEATVSGWYRVEELAQKIKTVGGNAFFERTCFVQYLFTRASERLPPQRVWRWLTAQESVLAALIRLDALLAHSQFVRNNQMRLVWGFEAR
jgi:ubiquinone/menaquinone biosynthesis C-methylase UbiE